MKKMWILMMTMFVAVGAIADDAKPEAKTALEKLVAECKELSKDFDDEAACPEVVTIKIKELTVEKAKEYLEKDLEKLKVEGLALANWEKVSSPKPDKAAVHIGNSMLSQVETLKKAKKPELAKKFETLAKLFTGTLMNEAKQGRVFTADTYWAQSVNARGWAVANLKDDSLTILLHGDTDG